MSTISSHLFVEFINDLEREICDIVSYGILSSSITLFGVVANVMNILVFYKQGFSSTTNISFFGLAISDLCSLITLLCLCILLNPLFVHSNQPMVHHEIQYLVAGLPHICFARITGWITIFITAERCLCITLPLKIKQIITPRVTTIAICFIYVVVISSFLPSYATMYYDWKFYPKMNKTLLVLVYRSSNKKEEKLLFIMYSMLGSTSFVAVIIFTLILIVQLRKKSSWRLKANADKNSVGSISARESKTVTMVIMITTILIVCYTPGVAVSIVTFFEPEFSVVGLNQNAFIAFWSLSFVFDAFNSSVNIFLYYNMSTKYRDTFRQVFCTGNFNVSKQSQVRKHKPMISSL